MSRRGVCNPYLRAISGIVIVGVALIQTVLVIDRLPVPASQLHPYLVATEAFSISKLDELRASNTPVLVDVTASWCLTCQVNEKLVLRRQEVQRVFRDKGVTILVADWTDRDEEITRYLASFGRSGVPLYVGYFPGKPPVVLSEILTQEEVLGWF
jgi:thiol:disulfide interchange protein